MKYFTEQEMAAKDTGVCKLADGFGDRIDALREAYGKPLIVNCGCRTATHNTAIGGHPSSLHVYDYPVHPTGGCCAVDLKLMSDEENVILKDLAMQMGFSVGDENHCIHIDDRTRVCGLPQQRFTWGK